MSQFCCIFFFFYQMFYFLAGLAGGGWSGKGEGEGSKRWGDAPHPLTLFQLEQSWG